MGVGCGPAHSDSSTVTMVKRWFFQEVYAALICYCVSVNKNKASQKKRVACMEYRAEKATASLHTKTSLQKVNFRRVLTPDWLFGGKGV